MMENLQAIGKLMVLVVYHILIFTTNVKIYLVTGGAILYFLLRFAYLYFQALTLYFFVKISLLVVGVQVL